MGNIVENNDELLEGSKYQVEQEKKKLELWFDDYYTVHEQKYIRLIALGKPNDDGSNPSDTLHSLYLEAESKRNQIQELEKLL